MLQEAVNKLKDQVKVHDKPFGMVGNIKCRLPFLTSFEGRFFFPHALLIAEW